MAADKNKTTIPTHANTHGTVESDQNESIRKRDAAVSKHALLYIAAGLIVLIVFTVTILPALFGGGEYLYKPGGLKILYATISLGVAIIAFAVIGDSGALVRYEKKTGTLIQVSGSAAGFLIFYYLLSSGLNPYSYLDVYLYNESGALMRKSDGMFEIKLASHISQTRETEDGHTTFALPRSEGDIRLFVNSVSGRLWEIKSMAPAECLEEGNRINQRCSSFSVTLGLSKLCLSDFTLSSHEAKPIKTSLKIVLDSLKEKLQDLSPDLPVNLFFTDALLKLRYHELKFELERKNESARSVCEHLLAIENAFNWSKGKRVVKTYLGCNTMLVALTNEEPKEGYKPCH